MALLIQLLGVAAVVGLMVMVLLVPVQVPLRRASKAWFQRCSLPHLARLVLCYRKICRVSLRRAWASCADSC